MNARCTTCEGWWLNPSSSATRRTPAVKGLTALPGELNLEPSSGRARRPLRAGAQIWTERKIYHPLRLSSRRCGEDYPNSSSSLPPVKTFHEFLIGQGLHRCPFQFQRRLMPNEKFVKHWFFEVNPSKKNNIYVPHLSRSISVSQAKRVVNLLFLFFPF